MPPPHPPCGSCWIGCVWTPNRCTCSLDVKLLRACPSLLQTLRDAFEETGLADVNSATMVAPSRCHTHTKLVMALANANMVYLLPFPPLSGVPKRLRNRFSFTFGTEMHRAFIIWTFILFFYQIWYGSFWKFVTSDIAPCWATYLW